MKPAQQVNQKIPESTGTSGQVKADVRRDTSIGMSGELDGELGNGALLNDNSAVSKTNWALPLVLVPTATVAVFLILLGLSLSKLHDSRLEDGLVALSDVSAQVRNNRLQLNAVADISLPAPLLNGLDNGVPLTFVMKLRLYEPVKFWFDKGLGSFERRYRLTYYELTRHYRVDSLETEVSRNYRSLSSALIGMGEFDGLEFQVSDVASLNRSGEWAGIWAGMTLSLDTAALPLPLQPLIKFSWALSSEEYQWPVI